MNSKAGSIIKIILLLILIFVLVVGSALLFDWLGLMDARKRLAPILVPLGISVPSDLPPVPNQNTATDIDLLENQRLATQLEATNLMQEQLSLDRQALDARVLELDNRETELRTLQEKLEQQQESLNQRLKQYEDKKKNLEDIAINFNNMPPAQAVAQFNAMDALLVVDVLRTATRLSIEQDTDSLVAFWISQMPADRGAEINQLMVEKPETE